MEDEMGHKELISELSKDIGVSEDEAESILSILKAGKLSVEKVGHAWQIPRRQVDRQLRLPFEKYGSLKG